MRAKAEPFLWLLDEPPVDLSMALRQIHGWSLEDGDIGREYWSAVARLLQSAQAMREHIRKLEDERASRRASSPPKEQKNR
ncbi:hypothetical protein [Variovorax sp. JS1663]|uniref:hypothetical protein n=1 Tax=Variovorax sp. JS1663 TaxID=1851577 RepID=UPI000B3461F4|nr:hypothetical protein [Variovorax sp. JS1663]OUM02972.1 hypothetical protein A8M77_08505 [Variovorax sp. JS1663]